MPPTRVVTAELPRMLQEIIGAVLAADDDIDVVAHAVTRRDLQRIVGLRSVDVVVIGLDGEALPDIGRELFAEDPSVTVLGMVAEGRHAFLYELRPHCVPLGAVSPETLAAAVRERARGREGVWTWTRR